MSSSSLSPFQDTNGQPIRSISTTTQLKRFLSGEWKEKTKAILGAQCLSIRRPDGLWVFQMSKNGKLIHTSFGKFPEVSMAQAKEKAFEHRRSIQENGVAPRQRQKKTTVKEVVVRKQCIDDIVSLHFHDRLQTLKEKKTNKEPAKAIQRLSNLYERFAQPVIGQLPPGDIRNSHIIRILTETVYSATTRTRMKAMLSHLIMWCVTKGLINPDDNHVDWRLINSLVPECTSVEQHHASVPVTSIPRLVQMAMEIATSKNNNLRKKQTALALVLTILTAQRVGSFLETDGQQIGTEESSWYSHWKDVDLAAKVWTIPPQCLKISRTTGNRAVRPLRIPLATETVDILLKIRNFWEGIGIALDDESFVVPRIDEFSRPHKSSSLRALIHELHEADLTNGNSGFFDPDNKTKIATTHGMRAAFQDWAISQNYPEILIEKALAHEHQSKVVRAYQRSDLLEERRPLMQAWASYCFSAFRKL